MARLVDRQFRNLIDEAESHGLGITGLHIVTMQRGETGHVTDMIRWLLEPELAGEFDYGIDFNDSRRTKKDTYTFYFNNADTAFAFKMRWK